MVLVIDHTANIDRIIDIIKKNPKLFKETKPKGLLRDVFFAEPDADIQDKPPPYCYVSLAKRFQYTREDIGTESTEFSQTITEYVIKVVHQDASRERTHRALYGFFDEFVNTFKNNPRLANPTDGITDPKCIRTKILPAEELDFGDVKEKLGFAITIQCQIGSHYLLTIGSLTDMPILSETSDEGLNSTRISDDTGLTRVSKGDNKGTKFLEYEYTKARFDTLKTLIDANNEISVTLKEGTQSRIMTVKPVYQRTSVRYDGRKTAVLQLEVISG